ncbi:MmgE/PrpD family protein [Amycolatopsis jejuensis]|uniref:MmgE/PrpD family protein n=1 Tax=Amycolatopsis jejuensis TaxID=330084 RepID=UPI00068EA1ED|nr:MmgE/PrpD family protein [Amycolatopsis jejuensis]
MRTGTAAEQLAEWALGLELGDVAADVMERIKLHLLDQIGAQIACHDLPTAQVTRDYATRFGREGVSSVIGTGLRLDAEAAGFVNATAGHSFEIDDYGYGAFAHPGCVVVPGALAIGQEQGASGRQVLRAVAAGFETVMRLSLASMPSMLLDRGFHETGAHGVFAVALTTSMLEGHDLDTAVHALAVAGSHASGTTEYAQTGGEVKRVHAGIGVAGGIRAARLARLGLTGPAKIFEGRRGFLQAFCNDYDEKALTEGLGERWFFPKRAALKPFASVGLIHAHFAAYDRLLAEHGFKPGDIESVVLGCDPLTLVHAGAIGPKPADMVAAQFSAEFGMAMRILKGSNSFRAYRELEKGGLDDPATLELAERVRLERDEECVENFPDNLLGRVTIRMKNGDVVSAPGYALGTPRNPLGREGVEAKYLDLVEGQLTPEAARRSVELIMNLEELADVGELVALLTDA